MNPAILRTSPQRLDPLSWYTRPLIPLSFAVVNLLFGVGSIFSYPSSVGMPWLDVLAVLVVSGACVYVQARSRSLIHPFGALDAGAALAMASVGLGLSVVANLHSTIAIQYWWAPVGLAIVIASLTPYSSILRLSVYSGVMLPVSTAASLLAFWGPDSDWPLVSTIVLGCVNIIVAFAAGSTFVALVVGRTLTIADAAGDVRTDDVVERRDVLALVERHTVARLGARVSPFLERVAESGVVTDEDRALAGQLARRLRHDLVERIDQNWLDSLSELGRVFLVDPEHRADRLNTAQRTALRGLVTTVLTSPGTDTGSLFLELRARENGTTAVALSFDVELPEGRRSMLIAPFYLALQSSVTHLRWDRARGVVTFEVE